MRAWLCLNPVQLKMATLYSGEIEVQCPKEALTLLAVYRTKKLGREVHGKKAVFHEVDWPKTAKEVQQ